ncbi:NADAR family protein [Bacteriovorax sp. DB6_IX]|uniref:NADAR family protein n=1 Tax=Bacteriovorax sp. DB6_IX TaxID=1353530 RepID=UPI00038A12B6|nr:NADAR family protein [Bacteriovorax sp. DB6_IX]EQC51655.1 putative swarming motility protein YbiA [Bacteriovorax sp. DB6_IX]
MTHTVKYLLASLVLLICINTLADAPHYDRYERTPAISYEGEILDFYSTKKAYGEFSNFGLFPILIEGVLWPTSEHYYQAHKYDKKELQEWVRAADSPYMAAKRGRDKSIPKRANWKEIKDQVMWIALKAKFSQYNSLRELLLSTNHSEIYEHTKNDCYWGDCGDRTGQNKLGKQLMRIRVLLRSGEL